MAFEKPPSLDDFSEIIPERKALTPQQKILRLLIVVLAGVVLILVFRNLVTSDLTAPLRGTGAVRGVAIDALGKPLNGNVLVEGTPIQAKTMADGSFELKNIPAGQQLIVVADAVSGREFPVSIKAGQTTDMGKIQLISTATP